MKWGKGVKRFTRSALLAVGLCVSAGGAAWAGPLEDRLFDSVHAGNMEGVRASIIAGADVFATDFQGNRAADLAVDLGLYDIAHYILSVMDRKRAHMAAQAPLAVDPTPQAAPVEPEPAAQPVFVPPPPPPPKPMAPPPAATPFDPAPPVSAPPAPAPDVAAVAPPTSQLSSPPPLPAPAPENVDRDAKLPSLLHDQPQNPVSIPSEPEPVVTETAIPDKAAPVLHVVPDEAEQSARKFAAADIPAPAKQAPPKVEVTAVPQVEATAQDQPPVDDNLVDELFAKMKNFFATEDEAKTTSEAEPQTETNEITLPLPPEPMIQAVPQPATAMLTPDQARRNRVLRLSDGLMLGKALPAKPAAATGLQAGGQWPCIEKGRWGQVCLEDARWNSELAAVLKGFRHHLYRGQKVISAYAGERATGYYAVFPEERFEAVVAVFTRLFGAPDDAQDRIVKAFQQQPEPNPVRLWYGFDEASGREVVLEIARFDDRRGTFPVMSDGVIRLSYTGEPSIFRYTAGVELQRLN